MWYKLFIRYWTNEILVRYVKVSSKWDLFAVIGYLYSNTLERIDRIDYIKVDIGVNLSDDGAVINVDLLKSKFEKDIK